MYLVYGTFIGMILYGLYYFLFSNFQYTNYLHESLKVKRRPNVPLPPPYPNGWFKLLHSYELKIKEVKYVEILGQNFAVYRGEDGKAYAVDAFCPHLGANLGIGGTVDKNCITCPFHGWKYDENGKCVNKIMMKDNDNNNSNNGNNDCDRGETYSCTHIENECISDCHNNNNNSNNKNSDRTIYIKKWEVYEVNNIILVWHHALNEPPTYFPKEIPEITNNTMKLRGKTTQYVECYVSDIPENISDVRHFDFVHSKHSNLLPLYFKWKPTWKASTDDTINELFDDVNKESKNFKMSKIQYCEKPFTSVIYFENTIQLKLFNKYYDVPFGMKLIGFQVGPGLVYLFFSTIFGKGVFIQSLVPQGPNKQEVTHTLYTESKMPYFMSAFILYGEAQQVLNDSYIWSNKIHLEKPLVCTNVDKILIKWRKWYSQFYSKKPKINDLSW